MNGGVHPHDAGRLPWAGSPQPAPTRPPRLAYVAAASALAAGVCLVGAGLPWVSARDGNPAVVRGAWLYTAECAGCHGVRREGWAPRTQADAALPPSAPSLGAGGHAWRHSDAELGRIVAQGIGAAASAGGAYGMPAFADRLDDGDIDAVLAYVKSRWPSSIRAVQATLNPGGEPALGALLRDPAWVFPAQCTFPAIQERLGPEK